MSDKKKPDVRTPNAAYTKMLSAASLPYNLMGGTAAMREHCKLYLPIEPMEDPTEYKVRVGRSFLFNKYGKTINDLVGRLFRNGIKQEDVPAELDELLEDVDLTGRDLARFVRDLFEDALHPGVTYLLVEYPTVPEPEATVVADGEPAPVTVVRSIHDEKTMGLRPYWVHIKQANMLNWRSELVNGVERLTRVQILETADGVNDDEWSDNKQEQVRVLYPGRWEIWRLNNDDKWVIADRGTTTLDFIPLIPVYTRQDGFMTGKPVLENLAELNLCHFQSSSDQRNILHVARVPILFGAGFDETTATITVGGNRFITNTKTDAKLTYVEHTGKAIEAGGADLKMLEDQMKVCAMEPLVPKTGAVTATAKAIDTAEAAAMLQTMGETLADALEQALRFSMDLLGKSTDHAGTLGFDCDFSGTLGQQADLDALQKARVGGGSGPDISRKQYTKELQRRDVLAEDYDYDLDQAELTAEGPALGDLSNTDAFGNPKDV